MGALMGVLEGLGLYVARADHWLGSGLFGSTAHISVLYLCPLFGMTLLAGVSLVAWLAMAALRVGTAMRTRMIFGLLSFLLAFDWMWLSERVSLYTAFIVALGLGVAAARWFPWAGRRILEVSPKAFALLAAYVSIAAFATIFSSWQQENAALAALPAPQPGAPNVVVIVLDTVRADHTSAYGYRRQTTPYLQQLAAEGTVFENAVATSSWTLPSHISMLTGRYPREHGAVLNGYDGRYATAASAFDAMGYMTAGFSGNMDWFTSARGMAQGFHHFEDGYWSLVAAFAQTGYGSLLTEVLARSTDNRTVLGYKRAHDVNETALRWLNSAPKRPFFLVLNYFDAHADSAIPLPPFRGMFESQPAVAPPGSTAEFEASEIDKARSDEYDGAIAYMDACLKEFVQSMRQRGLADNLVVVVTADHGELLGEHGLSGHRNALYWDLIHVPLVFWGGRAVPKDLRVDRPVSLASLPATLLELSGQRAAPGFSAPSLARLWQADADAEDWPFPISELAQMKYPGLQKMPNYSGSMAAVVTPHWLLIEHSTHGPSLFAWPEDKENRHDVVASHRREALKASAALAGCPRAGLHGTDCLVEDTEVDVQNRAGELETSGEQ